MPLFEVPYEVTTFGYALVEAECVHHARALVESGEFDVLEEDEGADTEILTGTIVEINPASPAF